jgi:predicted RNase H-like nuclease
MQVRIDPEDEVMAELDGALTWRNFADKVDPDGILSESEREKRATVSRRVFLMRMILRRSTIRSRQDELDQMLCAYAAELAAADFHPTHTADAAPDPADSDIVPF